MVKIAIILGLTKDEKSELESLRQSIKKYRELEGNQEELSEHSNDEVIVIIILG